MSQTEVEKKINEHLSAGWSTEIQWKNQRKVPATTSWLAVKLLQFQGIPNRDKTEICRIIYNFGIFTTDTNAYALSDLLESLKVLFEYRDLQSENYIIRFGKFDIAMLPELVENQRVIQHCSVNVTGKAYRRK